MSKEVNVYWAALSPNPHENYDRQIIVTEPQFLRKVLFENKNKNNKMKQNFFKCPAVTDIINNTLVWTSPKNTSVTVDIENGKVEPNKRYSSGDLIDWIVQHPPTISNNILVTIDYNIIFFAEEDLEMILSAPYFTNAPHLQQGAVVPGKFNIGSWFRPINIEMNLWEGNNTIEFKDGEHIAYFTFLTNKKINLKEFRMTEELYKITSSVSSSTLIFPFKPLKERYDLFRKRLLRGVILKRIKENLVY